MNIQQMNAAWAQMRRASTLAAYARMAAEAAKRKNGSTAEGPESEESKIEETPAEKVSAEEVSDEKPETEDPVDERIPDVESAPDEDPVQDPSVEEN